MLHFSIYWEGWSFLFQLTFKVDCGADRARRAIGSFSSQDNRPTGNGLGICTQIPPKEAHHLKVQKRRKRDAEEELFKNRCVMPGDV
jgi:hypothetical protein